MRQYDYRSVTWDDGVPSIETERLFLRITGIEALDLLVRFIERNTEHFRPWFSAAALNPSREELEKGLHEKHKLAREDRGYRFHLFQKADPSEIAGLCSLNDVRRGAIQQCTIGYAIDVEQQGKGLMTEAVGAAIKFAFDDLDLHRIEGSYVPANVKSGAILEQFGFRREAHIKEYLHLNNEWQDHYMNALINPLWRGTGRTMR